MLIYFRIFLFFILGALGVQGLAFACNIDGALASESAGAESVAQFERLKAQYAADEILNANRIGTALSDDPAHRAASFLSREQLEAGQVFTFRGGDGVQRTLLQTQGGFNSQTGIYEYIIEGSDITHQRFIDGGRITGFPNQIPSKLP